MLNVVPYTDFTRRRRDGATGAFIMPTCEIDFERFVEDWSRRLKNADRLLPIYEAVSNGLHAIREKNGAQGVVSVELIPDGVKGTIDAFKISDDGVGFTDANLRSFQRVFSPYKKNSGGKGVGRVSWLAFFEDVTIDSVYQKADGSFGKRSIVFSLRNEDNVVVSDLDARLESATGSVVTLRGVRAPFGRLSQKTFDEIAFDVFKHFFLESGRGVEISVREAEKSVCLSHWKERASTDVKSLKNETFHVTTARMRRTSKDDRHQAFYCADGRAVEPVSLEKLCNIPATVPFYDDAGAYFVNAYVQSDFLNRNVDHNRTKFEFLEGLFDDGSEPTREEIDRLVADSIRATFQEEIEALEAQKKQTIDAFIGENPQFRSLRRYAKPELDALKWNADKNDVGAAFRRAQTRLDESRRQTWEAFKKLDPAKISLEEARRKFNECVSLVETSKQLDLTAYVLKRKAVIEILEYLLSKDSDGKFQKERAIHDLIYPTNTTSTDERSLANNIWLIDDKLIPYDFIASDRPLKALPEIVSDAKERPDLVTFDVPMAFGFKSRNEITSLGIVEFKRPGRDDYKAESNNPITQMTGYARKLRRGYESDGRRVKISDGVKIYCYLIADITPSLAEICEERFYPTQDNEGYFGMTLKPAACVEVISYDKLLQDAKDRNAEFFRRLDLPDSVFI